jgi:radical SAM superfamily enzyme YgiQ (UPF0313 family)
MSSTFALKKQVKARLAAERGTIYREGPMRVALVYPSPYRIGMSSLGFQTIYRLLNERPDVVCERSFLPDDPKEYREARCPLFTYESETPVSDCDVIASSVAYEMEVVGLLECLDLAGVPLRAEDRGPGWPLVILGGPLTFSNPLPIAPFADVVVMGEGEQIIEVLLDWWRDCETRERFLRDAALLPGVYVPSIHGEVMRPVAQADDRYLPAYSPIITDETELSGMHLVENARGCHRGCTFCVMRRTTNGGMRAVEPSRVLATIPDYAKRVGLVGAATTDHPQLLEIVRPIVDSGREIGLSSLRADRLTDEFISLIARGGVRTLTVASDGSSQRMRDIAKKGIKEKHLMRAAELVRDHKLKLLKLYMVISYPEETMEDIDEMCDFALELSKICKVALGLSPLVAKKNTPLDGVPFEDERSLEAKLKHVQRRLGKIVDIRSTSVRWSWAEYQMSQGGWDMAAAAEVAWRGGGTFAAWRKGIQEHQQGHAALRRPTTERLQPGATFDDAILEHIISGVDGSPDLVVPG